MIDNPHGYFTIATVIIGIVAGMISLEGKMRVRDHFSNNKTTFSKRLHSMCLAKTYND